MGYFNSLQKTFTEPVLVQVFEINGALSYDKEVFLLVLELLMQEGEEANETPFNNNNAGK